MISIGGNSAVWPRVCEKIPMFVFDYNVINLVSIWILSGCSWVLISVIHDSLWTFPRRSLWSLWSMTLWVSCRHLVSAGDSQRKRQPPPSHTRYGPYHRTTSPTVWQCNLCQSRLRYSSYLSVRCQQHRSANSWAYQCCCDLRLQATNSRLQLPATCPSKTRQTTDYHRWL